MDIYHAIEKMNDNLGDKLDRIIILLKQINLRR